MDILLYIFKGFMHWISLVLGVLDFNDIGFMWIIIIGAIGLAVFNKSISSGILGIIKSLFNVSKTMVGFIFLLIFLIYYTYITLAFEENITIGLLIICIWLISNDFIKTYMNLISDSDNGVLNGDKTRWNKLLEFVSEIHCIVFMPPYRIIQYEYEKYTGKEPTGKEMFFWLNLDIKNKESVKMFEKMICDFCKQEIDNIELEAIIVETIKEYNKEVKLTEKALVLSVLASCGITLSKEADYIHFPSVRVFAQSVIGRTKNTNRKNIGNNDVIDTWISYCMPYVHEVITDKEQRGILEQAKKKVKEIEHLNIYKLSDF